MNLSTSEKSDEATFSFFIDTDESDSAAAACKHVHCEASSHIGFGAIQS